MIQDEYGPIEPSPEESIVIAEDGMSFDLGYGMTIDVIHTPGHAPHHISFLERKTNRLFIGETGGVHTKGMIRPGTPPPFNLDQLLNSIDKLILIAPTTLCYGHFGCAGDAVEKLHSHKQQVLLWAQIIAEGFLGGATIDDIYTKLTTKDKVLKEIERLPEPQRRRERFFINNGIAGFIGYFERYGPPKNLS